MTELIASQWSTTWRHTRNDSLVTSVSNSDIGRENAQRMKSQKLLRKRKQMRMFCCKSRIDNSVTSGIVERAKASTFERALVDSLLTRKPKRAFLWNSVEEKVCTYWTICTLYQCVHGDYFFIMYVWLIVVGSFQKCDICHNADQLLRRSDNWSDAQLFIIQSYRRQHIQQQFDERIKLQDNIASTYKVDHNGQPVTALLFGDGMTVYSGMYVVA